nr:unnamed protein product [Callosobruchus chinensis]
MQSREGHFESSVTRP